MHVLLLLIKSFYITNSFIFYIIQGDKGDKGDRGITTTLKGGEFSTGIIEGPPGPPGPPGMFRNVSSYE